MYELLSQLLSVRSAHHMNIMRRQHPLQPPFTRNRIMHVSAVLVLGPNPDILVVLDRVGREPSERFLLVGSLLVDPLTDRVEHEPLDLRCAESALFHWRNTN